MVKKKPRQGKRVPQRTCVGCRNVAGKRTMVRIVRSPEGVKVDATGKLAGRGAYLHANRSCWERGLRGSLQHALRTDLTEEEQKKIRAFLETLPAEQTDIVETA